MVSKNQTAAANPKATDSKVKPPKAKAPVQIPPVLVLAGAAKGLARAFQKADTINVTVDAAAKMAEVTFIRRERVSAKKNDPWATGEAGVVERKFSAKVPAIVRSTGRDQAEGKFNAPLLLPSMFATDAFRLAKSGAAIRFRVELNALGDQHALFLDTFSIKNGKGRSAFAGLAYQA